MPPTDSSQARSYSIRELTRITGLSADVLRVWERRYGFPCPSRDRTGARCYDPAEVQRLTLLQRALQRGHRIGSVIGLDEDELRALVELRGAPVQATDEQNSAVQRIMAALCSDDDVRLVHELRYAALNLGIRPFIREIVTPLTQLVGQAWEQGRIQIRHEHLLSDVLTTQLRVMWASQLGGERGQRVLLATLPSEQHVLGLEMAATYLAALGIVPRSMGANVPPEEIADAAEALDIDGIALSVSAGADLITTQLNMNLLGERLAERFPLAVGGAAASRLTLPRGAVMISDWSGLERWIGLLRGPAPLAGRA